jgi:hypothetical protein
MAEYPYPDPIVQVTDVQDLARDLLVIPNRRAGPGGIGRLRAAAIPLTR